MFMEKKQMKIASFLAMTTILMAQGHNIGRQHKTVVIARRNDAAIFRLFQSIRMVVTSRVISTCGLLR